MRDYLAYYIYFFLLLFFLHSCSEKTAFTFEEKILNIDEQVDSIFQFLSIKPDTVLTIIDARRDVSDDSVYYYYWENYKSKVYYYLYQDSLAITTNEKVLNFCHRSSESAHFNLLYSSAENTNGVFLQLLNNKEAALAAYKRAYLFAKNSEIHREIPNICINAGNVCKQLGNLPDAAMWARRAVFVADSLGMDNMKNAIYVNLGEIYTEMANYDKADDFYARADTLYPPSTDYESFILNTSMGNSFYFRKDYMNSLERMKKAAEIALRIANPSNISIAYANIADNYVCLNELNSAQSYLDLAEEYMKKEQFHDDAKEFAYNGICASLSLAKNDLKSAGYYLSRPFDESRIGAPYMLVYNRRLSEYYYRLGNYNKAYITYKLYKNFEDSIRNIQNVNNVAEIAARYSRDTTLLKKDIMISEGKTKITRLTAWVVFSIVFFLLVGVLAIMYFQYLRIQRRKEYQKNYANITKLRMEANAARLSPHFIFNVMNTLMPSFSNDDQGKEVVNHIISLFRSTLSSNSGVVTSLESELELVKNYASLSSIIHKRLPQLDLNVDPSVNLKTQIPTMLIQTSVENSLKYAFPGDDADGSGLNSLSVLIKDNKKFIDIIVEDNGVGYLLTQKNPNVKSKGTGNGVLILSRTIDLFNSSNLSKIEYNIEDISELEVGRHGTRVSIVLPKNFNYNLI